MKLVKDLGFDRLVWEKTSDHWQPAPLQDENGTWYIPIFDKDSEGFMVQVDRIDL